MRVVETLMHTHTRLPSNMIIMPLSETTKSYHMRRLVSGYLTLLLVAAHQSKDVHVSIVTLNEVIFTLGKYVFFLI